MSEEPHGVRSLPAGEGVGAEPGVHDAQVGDQTGVGEVQVVLPQLTRIKLTLVDDGLG